MKFLCLSILQNSLPLQDRDMDRFLLLLHVQSFIDINEVSEMQMLILQN